ncbi:MAG: membrane protein insertase YidC [Xanthomonadales bacterium]|nr:membrane protein insertase YidC [Xanthomonadales bacterium]
MNQNRVFLLVIWLALAFALWSTWQNDYNKAEPAAAAVAAGTAGKTATTADTSVPAIPADGGREDVPSSDNLPGAPAPTADSQPVATATASASARGISVTTDLLHVELSANGGSVRRVELLCYPQTTEAGSPPVEILDDRGEHLFIAQSGLINSAGNAPSHQASFTTDSDSYALAAGSDTLEVPFTFHGADGLVVRKTYVFERGSYQIRVRDDITNGTSTNWQGNAYRQLQRIPPPKPAGGWMTSPAAFSYTGGAWYSPEDKFNKLDYGEFASEPAKNDISGGWVALVQHYFLAAWIPDAKGGNQFSSSAQKNGRYMMRAIGPRLAAAPGETVSSEASLYVGPKLQDQLDQVAPGMELTVDYGIFTVISQPLFWLLSLLHDLLGNWGWAIIGVVVLLKLAFYWLSAKQFESMAKMRRVQPRLQALKERYGDDRQKLNQAMMELYKKEKINPASGCLPILVQIPVFIALYWVLVESVELRHAPWIGWIQDLTAKDPYFVLPALYIIIMFVTQRISPTPGMDPMQRRMMQAMPIMFGFLFAFFPAGLVLYWVTNGALSLLQQYINMKRHGGFDDAKHKT